MSRHTKQTTYPFPHTQKQRKKEKKSKAGVHIPSGHTGHHAGQPNITLLSPEACNPTATNSGHCLLWFPRASCQLARRGFKKQSPASVFASRAADLFAAAGFRVEEIHGKKGKRDNVAPRPSADRREKGEALNQQPVASERNVKPKGSIWKKNLSATLKGAFGAYPAKPRVKNAREVKLNEDGSWAWHDMIVGMRGGEGTDTPKNKTASRPQNARRDLGYGYPEAAAATVGRLYRTGRLSIYQDQSAPTISM